MNQIEHCDWLPEHVRWVELSAEPCRALSTVNIVFFTSSNESFIYKLSLFDWNGQELSIFLKKEKYSVDMEDFCKVSEKKDLKE